MKYPISDPLRKAISTLFDDSSIGLEIVGARRILPPDWYQEGKSKSFPIAKRARMLREKLENNICNMAAEKVEYGSQEETERLRAEATAALIALRELFLHLPEAFEYNN